MAPSLGTNPPTRFDLPCHLLDSFSWQQKVVLGGAKIPPCNGQPKLVQKKLGLLSGSCVHPPSFLAPRHRPSLPEDRIREQLTAAAEPPPPPPSPYDTAWVAMVPAPGRPDAPRFPQCVEWIMKSQHGDGSWCPSPGMGVVKDALSSTLACVLALRTWGVGEEHIRKGLRFIERNSSCITDDDERDVPVGFSVIFTGMLELGVGMGLELPLSEADVQAMLRLRDMELKRCVDSTGLGSKAFMAYLSEGLGKSQDWAQVMVYQRKNGSFFDSPSTTAAAAIHANNQGALDYLDSLISKFGSSVPTAYPLNVFTQLCMVDTLEKMGISHSFDREINNILDMAYRSWLRNDEEIMLDMATCAMAFRLLRMHGYGISSDGLAPFTEESSFHNSIQGYLDDTKTLLELYKASQVQIFEEDLILENIGSWSGKLLKQQLRSKETTWSVNPAEVQYALKFPFYATLDRLEHKRNIESFKTAKRFHMLKSAYRTTACSVNEAIASLAAHEFSSSQSVYQKELRYLESWLKEARLNELKFARVMPLHALFSAASTMFLPHLSEARIAWAKGCVLVTVIDDLFDFAGSREEAANLVALMDKWGAHGEIGFCSEHTEIIFHAIYEASIELNGKAVAVQNRSVMHHLAELWQDVARTMMAEAEWRWSGYVPSMEEYMRVSEVSFALGPIVLPSLYLVGPELPEEVVRSPEYGELFRQMNVCGRLLNDVRTYDKERRQGKLNGVGLLARRCGGTSTAVEEAKEQVTAAIEASRRELLRLVVMEPSSVPRPCKELFWNMCRVMHLFYLEKDGYFSPEHMQGAANAVLREPLQVWP